MAEQQQEGAPAVDLNDRVGILQEKALSTLEAILGTGQTARNAPVKDQIQAAALVITQLEGPREQGYYTVTEVKDMLEADGWIVMPKEALETLMKTVETVSTDLAAERDERGDLDIGDDPEAITPDEADELAARRQIETQLAESQGDPTERPPQPPTSGGSGIGARAV